MGGKAIVKWSDEDKAWLRSRFVVDGDTAQVYLKNGDEITPCRVGPARKQYLAVAAKIGGKWTKVRLHMLVWFFVTGEQSMKMIDHKEGDPIDQVVNRFSNLREATDKQNCANKAAKGYRSYVKADGTEWYFASMTWKDRVTGKIKFKRSGLVQTVNEARIIYMKWKRQRFGEFAFQCDVDVSCGSQVNL